MYDPKNTRCWGILKALFLSPSHICESELYLMSPINMKFWSFSVHMNYFYCLLIYGILPSGLSCFINGEWRYRGFDSDPVFSSYSTGSKVLLRCWEMDAECSMTGLEQQIFFTFKRDQIFVFVFKKFTYENFNFSMLKVCMLFNSVFDFRWFVIKTSFRLV